MKKYLSLLILTACISGHSFSQDTTMSVRDTMLTAHDTILSVNEPISNTTIDETFPKRKPGYKLNLAVDIPLTVVTTATTLYGFSKIYSKDRLTVEEVESLDPATVNSFDRSATRHYSESATKVADLLFYGSMPLPILLLADSKMRKDYPKILTLYLETMGATGILYVSAVHFGSRYRPYTYNDDAPMDFKLRGGSRNSFFAGHPALVATSTFFMATTYATYHPESKIKWLFYTLAGAATATVATGRYLGGRHFPSDLIVGVTIGTVSGILIPSLHRNKDLSKRKTALMPYFGESSGLVMVHRF